MATLKPVDDTLAALVAAIRENPADDVTRLVAADWYEEHGFEKRATYIRLAVEVATNACEALNPDDGRRCRDCEACCVWYRCWREYTRGEWGHYQQQWNVNAFDGFGLHPTYWERGFILTGSAEWRHWQKHGPKAVRWEPIKQVVLGQFRPLDGYAGRASGVSFWWWYRGHTSAVRRSDPSVIPTLFPHLTDGTRHTDDDGNEARYYGTPTDAYRDLGQAAVRWAVAQPVG